MLGNKIINSIIGPPAGQLGGKDPETDHKYYCVLFVAGSLCLVFFSFLIEYAFPKMIYFWPIRLLEFIVCLMGAYFCRINSKKKIHSVINFLAFCFLTDAFLVSLLNRSADVNLLNFMTLATCCLAMTHTRKIKALLLYNIFLIHIYLFLHWNQPSTNLFYTSSLVFSVFSFFAVHSRQKFFQSLMGSLTEKERVETELTLARHLSVLGEMTSGIAHEINNPLQVLQGKVLKVQRELEKGSSLEEINPHLNRMNSVIDKIVDIVKAMRLLSRSTMGEVEDAILTVDIAHTLKDVAELCNYKFMSKEVELICVGLDQPVEMQCVEAHIGQIVMNLLYNALDAVSSNDRAWVKLELSYSEKWVEIKVSDCGEGIPEEIKGDIMRPFYTTKKADKGLGIGLSLIQRIVNLHNGFISINPQSEFTEFIIELPRIREQKDVA